MNLIHHWLCQSRGWKNTIEKRVPWALEDVELGAELLEIGPGFGVATDLLFPLVENLTCVEIDPLLAQALGRRMLRQSVTVLCEDATSLSLPDASFDAVVCFTMLHHVPSTMLQDRLLAEVARVLRPGGVFLGTDSLYDWRFRLLHLFDTMVVVNPGTFPKRLQAAGFVDAHVDTDGSAFRFRARKPVLTHFSGDATTYRRPIKTSHTRLISDFGTADDRSSPQVA
jgi:SAM-dependent methyltransferase